MDFLASASVYIVNLTHHMLASLCTLLTLFAANCFVSCGLYGKHAGPCRFDFMVGAFRSIQGTAETLRNC